jgi:hypothetical protein
MEELQVKPINTSYNLEKLQAISDRLLGSCLDRNNGLLTYVIKLRTDCVRTDEMTGACCEDM